MADPPNQPRQPQSTAGNVPSAGSIAESSQVQSPYMPTETSAIATGATWGPIPAMTPQITFRELGQSGLRQFSGWVREEFLQQLVGRQGAQKFREMRDNSPVIGGILSAIHSTMRKVEWRVEPPLDSPKGQEAVEFVEGMLHDMTETWEDNVAQDLSMVEFGFCFKEIVYKVRNGRDPGPDPNRPGHQLPRSEYDDGKIAWRRLPIRSQDTILKWFFSENGQVKGVTQQPWIGPLVDIPIEKGLLFRAKPYKNNPEGISVLRNSYVPYYYQKRLQEHEAILLERMSGVPVLKLPALVMQQPEVLDSYKRIITNVRIDEQMGVLIPSDVYAGPNGPSSAEQYKFELVTPSGGGRGVMNAFEAPITRYGIQMMTSVLADFLQLGHEARGTQSLAVSKVDMFFLAMEGYLNANAAVYNRYGLPRIWELNGMDADTMPNLVPDLAQRVDLDVLSNFVLRLSQAGMPMFPNEELQTFLLDAGGLPDIADTNYAALQAAGLLDEQLDREDDKNQAVVDRMQQDTEQSAEQHDQATQSHQQQMQQGRQNMQQQRQEMQQKPDSESSEKRYRTPMEKIILASWARRQNRMAGPRFGITTKRHSHGRRR